MLSGNLGSLLYEDVSVMDVSPRQIKETNISKTPDVQKSNNTANPRQQEGECPSPNRDHAVMSYTCR